MHAGHVNLATHIGAMKPVRWYQRVICRIRNMRRYRYIRRGVWTDPDVGPQR